MSFSWIAKLTKKQRIGVLLITAGLFGTACLLVIFMNFRGITVEVPINNPPQEEAVTLRDAFTGEVIAQPTEGSRVACVMVENSADAWPLSGIEDAFLVIEAPVEGGIPRFTACFTEGEQIEKIGPVRSARPYYVSWVSGFEGALYAHVGGSPEALERLVASKDIVDLNEFWNGASFWRDSIRYAPHNAYTSSTLLWAAADHLQVGNVQSPGWTYADSVRTPDQSCNAIHIPWQSSSGYSVLWDCDAETGQYVRKQGGASTTSSDGDVYTAANVAIIEANISIVDEVGRRHIATEGTGNALVCSGGTCENAIWHKEGVDKPLQFFISYPDEPAVFAPGKTWIEVVEDLGSVQMGEIE